MAMSSASVLPIESMTFVANAAASSSFVLSDIDDMLARIE
jgi:hypothetical protein